MHLTRFGGVRFRSCLLQIHRLLVIDGVLDFVGLGLGRVIPLVCSLAVGRAQAPQHAIVAEMRGGSPNTLSLRYSRKVSEPRE